MLDEWILFNVSKMLYWINMVKSCILDFTSIRPILGKRKKIQKHVFYLRIMVRHVERVIVMEYDPNLCWEWPTHYNCFLIVFHLTNWKVTLSLHTLERYMKRLKDGEIISNFLCHEHILITGDDRGHSDWGCFVSLGWMIISLCFIL